MLVLKQHLLIVPSKKFYITLIQGQKAVRTNCECDDAARDPDMLKCVYMPGYMIYYDIFYEGAGGLVLCR